MRDGTGHDSTTESERPQPSAQKVNGISERWATGGGVVACGMPSRSRPTAFAAANGVAEIAGPAPLRTAISCSANGQSGKASAGSRLESVPFGGRLRRRLRKGQRRHTRGVIPTCSSLRNIPMATFLRAGERRCSAARLYAVLSFIEMGANRVGLQQPCYAALSNVCRVAPRDMPARRRSVSSRDGSLHCMWYRLSGRISVHVSSLQEWHTSLWNSRPSFRGTSQSHRSVRSRPAHIQIAEATASKHT